MRLTCLIPENFHALVKDAEINCIDFVAYRSLPDAWNIAEDKSPDIFISHPEDDYSAVLDMLGAFRVICPNALHIHIYENRTAEELIDLVNKSYAVRLLPLDKVEQGLLQCCSDVVDIFERMGLQHLELARLKEENEQFEFMLRQSLLS